MQEIETQLELVGSNWVLLTTNCARILFFKIGGGGKPGLFLFLSMSQNNDKFDFKWKKHRWCDWDSNLGPQDGRRRRIQQTMAGPIIWTLRCRKLFKPSKYLAFYYLSCKFSFECKIK